MSGYPQGRSAYRPGHARTHEPTPQTDPDLFSVEDIRAEIRYLTRLDKRYGAHHLRALRRLELTAVIASRRAKP